MTISLSKPPGYKGLGRPSKLTPELQQKICDYIAKGNYYSTACQAVGIDERTLSYWLHHAKQEADTGGGIYFQFYLAIKKAEASREAIIVQKLMDAAMPGEKKRVRKVDSSGNETVEVTETGGDWLAAATFLERRHPERWGRRERTSPINAPGSTFNVVYVNKAEIKESIESTVHDDSPLIEGEIVGEDEASST